jgi:hypothetical protein
VILVVVIRILGRWRIVGGDDGEEGGFIYMLGRGIFSFRDRCTNEAQVSGHEKEEEKVHSYSSLPSVSI